MSRQPSIPAALASRGELLQTVAQHRIQIGEQQQRNLRGLADLARDIQNLRRRWCRRLQRAIRAALDHGAVGDGIGERHAQLDQIHAAAFQRRDELRACAPAMGSPAVI